MSGNLSATAEITINAPVSMVWDALMNPELVKKYFFGTNVKSDWEVGSPVTFTGEYEGKTYMDKGTVLRKEANKLLVYSYWSSMRGQPDTPENYMNITYRLAEKDGGTHLSLVQDNVSSEKERQHSEQNWNVVLGNLKKLLEEGN
jgi:uncharacterized protein YndB with AHSA1/START domain